MSLIQTTIIRQLVTDLVAAGFHIDVNDNDGDRETHLAKSQDVEAIVKAVFNDEIDSADYCLDCFANPTNENSVGWVRLIDGNESTVISDYSTRLEPCMAGADALSEKIDGREEEWTAERVARLEAVESAAAAFVAANQETKLVGFRGLVEVLKAGG